MADESELVPRVIGEVVVTPGTTYNGATWNVAIINNRQHPVRVVVHELAPPPPPPKCREDFPTDDDDYIYLWCEKEADHEGPHRGHKEGNTVLWWSNDAQPPS